MRDYIVLFIAVAAAAFSPVPEKEYTHSATHSQVDSGQSDEEDAARIADIRKRYSDAEYFRILEASAVWRCRATMGMQKSTASAKLKTQKELASDLRGRGVDPHEYLAKFKNDVILDYRILFEGSTRNLLDPVHPLPSRNLLDLVHPLPSEKISIWFETNAEDLIEWWKVKYAISCHLNHGEIDQSLAWIMMYHGRPAKREILSAKEEIVWYEWDAPADMPERGTVSTTYRIVDGFAVNARVATPWFSFWKGQIFPTRTSPKVVRR